MCYMREHRHGKGKGETMAIEDESTFQAVEDRLPSSAQRSAEVLLSIFNLIELLVSTLLRQPTTESSLADLDLLVQYQEQVRDSILPTLNHAVRTGKFR